jgi:adenylate kinase
LEGVVVFEVPEEALVERIAGRRSCSNCGAPYHVKFSAPKQPGICDRCGGPLVQREDDREEKVRTRLSAYRGMTEEIIPYYEKMGIVRRIDGDRPQEQVASAIEKALE